MEILVIGNGFDLAHELPTKYDNFLDFCVKTRKIYTLQEDVSPNEYKLLDIDNWEIDSYIKNTLLVAFGRREYKRNINNSHIDNLEVTTSNIFLNELYSYIDHNIWLEYFFERRSAMGENWIDFEIEISKVIQSLDEAINVTKLGKSLREISKVNFGILNSVGRASKLSMQDVFRDEMTLIHFAALLDEELGRLIRALEIYIVKFVGDIPVEKRNVDIDKLHPDHVLSFNYSNTYERVYGEEKKVEYDYIHGKADINKNVNTSNLVLGIDEYLDDTRKDKELELLSFKKFYQRIYKSTGNRYLNWVDKIKDEYANYMNPNISPSARGYPRHTLYIFGHSLDVTDRDVLKLFICNDNVQTKIFYYRKNEEDKTELAKLIRNLIQIMGQEELIRRTGGTHKTIEFVPQTLV